MLLYAPTKMYGAKTVGMGLGMEFKGKTGLGQYFRLGHMPIALRSNPATVKEEKQRYLTEKWKEKRKTRKLVYQERRLAHLIKGSGFIISKLVQVGTLAFLMVLTWRCCAASNWKIDSAVLINLFSSIAAKLIG